MSCTLPWVPPSSQRIPAQSITQPCQLPLMLDSALQPLLAPLALRPLMAELSPFYSLPLMATWSPSYSLPPRDSSCPMPRAHATTPHCCSPRAHATTPHCTRLPPVLLTLMTTSSPSWSLPMMMPLRRFTSPMMVPWNSEGAVICGGRRGQCGGVGRGEGGVGE